MAETVGEGVEDDILEIVGDLIPGPIVHAVYNVAKSLFTKLLEEEFLSGRSEKR